MNRFYLFYFPKKKIKNMSSIIFFKIKKEDFKTCSNIGVDNIGSGSFSLQLYSHENKIP